VSTLSVHHFNVINLRAVVGFTAVCVVLIIDIFAVFRVSHVACEHFDFLPWLLTLESTAYTVGAFCPPPLLTYIAPRPPDPDLPESQAYVVALERQLQKPSISLKYRATENPEAWYETRPYGTIPEDRRVITT
jgi:hypothetical protein